MKIDRSINFSIMLILVCYPVLSFGVRGGMNGALFLLTVISIYLLFRSKSDKSKTEKSHYDAIVFGVAMSSGLLAIFFSQIYHQNLVAHAYDSASRFLLAVPIFMALRKINMRVLLSMQYGFPLGAISALLFGIFGAHFAGEERIGTHFLNPIMFGDLALILGFLSAFSINWETKDPLPVLVLKLTGLIAGISASVLSGSRGGWIAIPFFLLVWLLHRESKNKAAKIWIALLGMTLFGVFAYFLSERIHSRLGEIYTDLLALSEGNADTSLGIRLQLWKAAWHLFMQNPVFGLGADGFSQAMTGLADEGFISFKAAGLGRGEVHNEILANMVRFGLFGLVSILSIYLAPMIILLRARKSTSNQQRTAALMGICLVTGFFIFGLTVETFNLKMIAAFYGLTLAALLAAAVGQNAEKGRTRNIYV